jgi:hypothetical protein
MTGPGSLIEPRGPGQAPEMQGRAFPALADPCRGSIGGHSVPPPFPAPPHGLCPLAAAALSGNPHGFRRPANIMLPRSLLLAWASRAESLRDAR